MKAEVWLSKRRENPPYLVFFMFEQRGQEFRGTIGAEKVFHEGKEVLENKEFNNIYKVEIVEEQSFEGGSALYVYLWEEKDDMKEEIALPSKPLWRKATVVVR